MSRLAPALAVALLAAPALLAAQDRAPAPRPAAARTAAARDSSRLAARPDARRAPRGFERGHLQLDARTWVGINGGGVSLGASGETAVTSPGALGPGLVSVGASVDAYRQSSGYSVPGVGSAKYSVTVIPIGAFANYHLSLSDRRFDPYVGLGLGYEIVRASASTSFGESASGTASGAFLFGQLGARYFVSPRLAVQAQTGFGVGALSVGVSWKR